MMNINSIALLAATEIMALPAADDLLGGAGQLKAKIQIIVRNYVEDALDKAQLAEKEKFESLHQHISHLRGMIYPQNMSESAAWRAVPVKHLSAIQSLIDPPPVVVGDKTMVFVNPHAAEALTAISAEVRAMLSEPPPKQPAFGHAAGIDKPDEAAKNAVKHHLLETLAALPVVAAPEGWIDVNDRHPKEDQLVLICGVIPPDVQADVKGWRCLARFKAGDFLDMNGCTRNSATHWMQLADSFADAAAPQPASVSAAPSGEVERDADLYFGFSDETAAMEAAKRLGMIGKPLNDSGAIGLAYAFLKLRKPETENVAGLFKELKNVDEVIRHSDQSVRVRFKSARSATQFESAIRDAAITATKE